MQPTISPTSMLGRIAGGIFAGAVLGLFIEAFILQPPPEDRRILLIGPGVGSVLVATIAVFFGGRELQGWFKIVSVSFLAGVSVGAFGGAVLFPAIMVLIVGYDPVFHGKIYAVRANAGALVGIPLGAALGFLVGFVIWWRQRNKARAARPPLVPAADEVV